MLLPAQPKDHQQLTQITKLSKAHWGYSQEQMTAWSEDLTISKAYITNNLVYKFVEKKRIVGYYSLIDPEENNIQLDNLFVHPSKIGKGYGRFLLEAAVATARMRGFTTMTLHSDPHATAFYKKKGFEIIGQLPTSIPNRFLPIMRKKI